MSELSEHIAFDYLFDYPKLFPPIRDVRALVTAIEAEGLTVECHNGKLSVLVEDLEPQSFTRLQVQAVHLRDALRAAEIPPEASEVINLYQAGHLAGYDSVEAARRRNAARVQAVKTQLRQVVEQCARAEALATKQDPT